jgi:predicted DNA-binding transcriptional regulator AlpA
MSPDSIRNVQRAAVCGLLLAGMPYKDACAIAGARGLTLRKYIPHDWFRTADRLTAQRWERIRADYESRELEVREFLKRHGIGQSTLYKRVREEGWEKRPTGRRTNPAAARHLPKKQYLHYRKLRDAGIGRAVALSEAVGVAP